VKALSSAFADNALKESVPALKWQLDLERDRVAGALVRKGDIEVAKVESIHTHKNPT
jgi:hypothetical protein